MPHCHPVAVHSPGMEGLPPQGQAPRAGPYRAEAAQQVGNRDRGTGTGAGTAWGGYTVPNGGEAGVTHSPARSPLRAAHAAGPA